MKVKLNLGAFNAIWPRKGSGLFSSSGDPHEMQNNIAEKFIKNT